MKNKIILFKLETYFFIVKNKDIKHIKYKKFCISINPIFPLSVLKIT